MKPTFRERLKMKYQRLHNYIWDGYTAPEMQPDIQSRQVKALAEMVEELEQRVEILERLEAHRQQAVGKVH